MNCSIVYCFEGRFPAWAWAGEAAAASMTARTTTRAGAAPRAFRMIVLLFPEEVILAEMEPAYAAPAVDLALGRVDVERPSFEAVRGPKTPAQGRRRRCAV